MTGTVKIDENYISNDINRFSMVLIEISAFVAFISSSADACDPASLANSGGLIFNHCSAVYAADKFRCY